jgi:hypothetical protein
MSLSFEDYVEFVEATSDYAPERRVVSGRYGVISELGELLALYDERRVKRKGASSREALLSELGDVLWYEVWRLGLDAPVSMDWRSAPTGVTSTWPDHVFRGAVAETIGQVVAAPCVGGRSVSVLLRCFGLTIEQIAEANVGKLSARRAAGTLHDREGRRAVDGGDR